MDHAGHGLSEGERAYVRDVEELAADVLFLARRLKRRHADLPLLLYGHSMGGAVAVVAAAAAAAAEQKTELFRGVYLEAPLIALHPHTGAPWKRMVGKLLGWLPKLRLPSTKLDQNRITRTPHLHALWKSDDKFFHGQTQVGTGLAMMQAEEHIEQLLATKRITFPFFIATGDDDIACDYRAALSFYERAASAEKRLKVYPGMTHTLRFDSEEAVPDMIAYFEERVGKKAA